MKMVCSGKMTMGQIAGEAIYYIGEGARKVVITIKKDEQGLFHAVISIDDSTKDDMEVGNDKTKEEKP